MKLYKIENDQILQEISGHNLTSEEGFVELTDEEADAKRAKSYKKQDDFLKDGFAEIEERYQVQKTELENQMQEEQQKENKNEERLTELRTQMDNLYNQEMTEKADVERRKPETREQEYLKIVSAEADETARRRLQIIEQQKAERAEQKRNINKTITDKILKLKEESKQKIYDSKMSKEQKKNEMERLEIKAQEELSKWGQ